MNLQAQRFELGPRQLHFQPRLTTLEHTRAVAGVHGAPRRQQHSDDEQVDDEDRGNLLDERLPEPGRRKGEKRLKPDRQLRGDDQVGCAQRGGNRHDTESTGTPPGLD